MLEEDADHLDHDDHDGSEGGADQLRAQPRLESGEVDVSGVEPRWAHRSRRNALRERIIPKGTRKPVETKGFTAEARGPAWAVVCAAQVDAFEDEHELGVVERIEVVHQPSPRADEETAPAPSA